MIKLPNFNALYKNKNLKNLIFVYGTVLVNGILGILFIPLFLNYLGADGYGLFSIYVVLASFVSIADFGVGRNLQRILTIEQNPECRKGHIQNAVGVYLCITLVIVAVMPFLITGIPQTVFPIDTKNKNSLEWIIFLSLIEYPLTIPVAISQSVCFANEKFDRYSAFSFISGITRYMLMFAAILIYPSPVMVVSVVVGKRLLDIYYANRLMGKLPANAWYPKLTYHEFKPIFKNSLGVTIAQGLQSLLISLGSILINMYYGLEGLGKYRVAFDLSSKVWVISTGFGMVIFPKFVKGMHLNEVGDMFRANMTKLMNYSWVCFNFLGIFIISFALVVINLGYVHDREISDLFILLVLGVCFNAHTNFSYELLQASKKYKEISYITISTISIMTACFLLLKARSGIYSIGFAWIISQYWNAIIFDSFGIARFNNGNFDVGKLGKTKHLYVVPTLIVLTLYFVYTNDGIFKL